MYISITDAQTLLGRILDVYKNDQDIVQTAHLQLVIDEAEGMINSAIGSRYTIPATSTNAVSFLRALVVPILRFKSYTQFAETEDAPNHIITEYEMTLKTLAQLANQTISLPDTSEKTTGRASHIKIAEKTAITTGF